MGSMVFILFDLLDDTVMRYEACCICSKDKTITGFDELFHRSIDDKDRSVHRQTHSAAKDQFKLLYRRR